MQLLDPIYESLLIIGLSAEQSIQKHPFNARNLCSLLFSGLNLVSDIGFVIYGASDALELTDALYITFTIICSTSISINLVWKMRLLFEFLGGLDDTVTQSKLIFFIFLPLFFSCDSCDYFSYDTFSNLGLEDPMSKMIYTKTNGKIHKTARILNILLVGMSPFLTIVPPVLVSMVTFFTTDLGADALQLPFPMW